MFHFGVLLESLVRGPCKISLVTIKWQTWWDGLRILSFSFLVLFINMFHQVFFAAGSTTTLVTLKELQFFNWFFRTQILISLKLSLQQFSQALLFQNVWRKLLWKEQLCQLWQGLLPFYALVGLVWRGTSYCRILAEEEGKELGSGHDEDAQALQTAEYKDFHHHSSTSFAVCPFLQCLASCQKLETSTFKFIIIL